ncbi:hypothetical protein [Sandarakinorhabdus oryzae]|uniref:hypothetical protein n=1 Tax=Sandarakinorhabdus oryzae TaxID=2675220 RepID=UPI0012E18AD2|nr:hypothetical protein [Sandarakinorhabdus oryzae]
MRLTLIALATLPILLSACATPAQRITSNLTQLGVPPGQAQCMGQRLGQRLSFGQLRRLQELTSIRAERLQRMSIREIANKLSDERDPGLVAEFLRAGVGCLI